MNHSDFQNGYKSGNVQARVDKNAAGFLYKKPSQIPQKYRVRLAIVRTLFFGGTAVGIALFLFVKWYFAGIVLVIGLWFSTTAQKVAAKGVLETALRDSSFFQMLIDKRVLIIKGGDSDSASSEAAIVPLRDQSKVSEESYNIAADFGDVFDKNDGLSIYDVSQLPHPKDSIRAALFDIYQNDTDHNRKELVKVALLELANYQEGVGSKPIRGTPDLSQLMDEGDQDPTELAERVLEAAEETNQDQYSKYRKIGEEEYAGYKEQLGI
jgi:hypothetical protein